MVFTVVLVLEDGDEQPGIYTLAIAIPSPPMLGGNNYQGGKNGGECMREKCNVLKTVHVQRFRQAPFVFFPQKT